MTRHCGGLRPQEGQGNAVACPARAKGGRIPSLFPRCPLQPRPASHSHTCARGTCRRKLALVSLRPGPGGQSSSWLRGPAGLRRGGARGCLRPAVSTPALLRTGTGMSPEAPEWLRPPPLHAGQAATPDKAGGQTPVLPGPGPHSASGCDSAVTPWPDGRRCMKGWSLPL